MPEKTIGLCPQDGPVEVATLTLWVSHRWQVSPFCMKCGVKIDAPTVVA